MSLENSFGNQLYVNKDLRVQNPLMGVEIDYYFMAKLSSGSKTEISMKIWTVIVDCHGEIYGMCTKHIGHYRTWKETIKGRMENHLKHVGLDSLQITRMLREIEIKKEGHLIKHDYRTTGSIGIDGSNQLYIRRNKFTYFKL